MRMHRGIWLAAVGVAVAVGVTLVALPRAPEWTTSSPEALAEFEAGFDAQQKVYTEDALKHFARAIELDPDFLFAKLRYAALLRELNSNPEQANALFAELAEADITALTPRERFLIERMRALRDGRVDEAAHILDGYLANHPDDPHALHLKAQIAWNRGYLEEAERLFQQVLRVEPNWVVAYNALGYIAMTQGRFAESEEYFMSYRFIAPDQANPHDSLGELFITTGRYDEAADSLERAIEIRPDFFASYDHLISAQTAIGDFEDARDTIERARREGMSDDDVFRLTCQVEFQELERNMEWRKILEKRDSECVTGFVVGSAAVTTHLAACRLGDWDTVQSIEDEAAALLATMQREGAVRDAALLQNEINHMKGVRLAIKGEFELAEELILAADRGLTYMETEPARFKLNNRLVLVEVLFAAGRDADAHKLLTEVRSVNPAMAEDFQESGFRVLGLDRG